MTRTGSVLQKNNLFMFVTSQNRLETTLQATKPTHSDSTSPHIIDHTHEPQLATAVYPPTAKTKEQEVLGRVPNPELQHQLKKYKKNRDGSLHKNC